MQLKKGSRVTILDGSIRTGSIGRVRSVAFGAAMVEIETGIGRGFATAVRLEHLGAVAQIDGNSMKILELMAPEGV
jgi:hypothetical protein